MREHAVDLAVVRAIALFRVGDLDVLLAHPALGSPRPPLSLARPGPRRAVHG
ncbi:MAG: hypothetical protein ACRDRA_06365 [Pseudonocardiaceae bacterium]